MELIRGKIVKENIFITKTNFVNFMRCHKMLWLNKFKKGLRKKPSDAEILNIKEGHKVGEIALKHPTYMGGVLIKSLDVKESIEETKVAFKKKSNTIFYEPAFFYDYKPAYCTDDGKLTLFLRSDILKKNNNGEWDLIEVKSSSSHQEIHYWDIAFQAFVLQKLGKKLGRILLMKPSKEFSKENGDVDLEKFFTIKDVTNIIVNRYLPQVPVILDRVHRSLDNKAEPKKVLGSHCKNPWLCPFMAHCHKGINSDSVEKFTRITKKKRQVFRKLKVKYIHQIPDNMSKLVMEYSRKSKSPLLTDRQRLQLKVALNGQPFLDKVGLKDFLGQIKFPLYHLDFEAYNRAIPDFVGMKPHQFVVFQASLHKEFRNKKLEHYEFIQDNKLDPRKGMIKFLLSNIGKKGSIIVYNKSFEATRIKELARDFPEFAKDLLAMNERMIDLEIPFKKYYYHHDFEGRSSIKKVLPVVVDELSYDRLNIQNGADAQAIYRNLIQGEYLTEKGYKGKKFEKVKQDLLDYCKLDTYAMVMLLRKLRDLMKIDDSLILKM